MPAGKVVLPNLIWQPTFICRTGCPNCYINKSPMKVFNEQKQRQLLSLLCSGELLVENEVIISLDTVPRKGRKEIQDEVSLVSDILQCGSFRRHLAVRDIRTLSFWMKKAPGLLKRGLISRISISNPKGIGKYKELIGSIPVNWNFLSSGDFSISKEDEELLKTIHLILEKEELGKEIKEEKIDKFLEIKEKLSGNRKVVSDKCWEVSRDQRCCSACIDKIHVWPSGSITGCPYDSSGVQKHEEGTMLKTLQKITYERKEHPWNVCRLNSLNPQTGPASISTRWACL